MNDRIKELSDQCWDRRTDGLHFDIEQFAELIINECCKMMIDLEKKYPANLTVREIKQHFGVEQ